MDASTRRLAPSMDAFGHGERHLVQTNVWFQVRRSDGPPRWLRMAALVLWPGIVDGRRSVRLTKGCRTYLEPVCDLYVGPPSTQKMVQLPIKNSRSCPGSRSPLPFGWQASASPPQAGCHPRLVGDCFPTGSPQREGGHHRRPSTDGWTVRG